jgi:hypothetical protein
VDIKQLVKDIVTLNFKSLNLRVCKLMAIVKRKVILPSRKNYGNGKNIKDIPIIINNKNRLTYLLQLINWLEKNGYSNIYIIDNASTYPPLLEYYSKTKYHVFRLKKNVGKLALWESGIIKQFIKDYYVYTDPDVVPIEDCPSDILQTFMNALNMFPGFEKAGFGLKIDDLPDHYEQKKKVIEWEKKFWEKPIIENLFDAEIDTTFALYRPYTNGAIWIQRACRTGGQYVARHLPWYEDTAHPTEEDAYYMAHIKGGISHWIEPKDKSVSNAGK